MIRVPRTEVGPALLPDSLMSDVGVSEESIPEPAEDSAPVVSPPPVTIALRWEDATYVLPELSLNVLPRTNQSWGDLRILLAASTKMLNARTVEEVEERTLDLLLASLPAGVAVVKRLYRGILSSTAAARPGHPSDLSRVAQDLFRQAMAEQASLLYLAETTAIATPLLAHGETVGALVVETTNGGVRLDKHHLQLATGIASIAAPALRLQLQLRG